MTPQGKWVRNEAKYATGEIYRIGKINVGTWHNPSVTKGSPPIYRGGILLPGIRMKNVDFSNAEDARKAVERAVDTWFEWFEWLEEP